MPQKAAETAAEPALSGTGQERVGLLRVLRMIYWSAGRDPRRIPHLVRVLLRFAGTAPILAWRRFIGERRRAISIALVEHLGDIVAAEPIARYARARFPDRPLQWFVGTPYAGVPRCFPEVDRVITAGCLTEWMLLSGAGLAGDTLDLHIAGRYCPKCSIGLVKFGESAMITPETFYRFGSLLAIQCQSAGIMPLDAGPVLRPDAAAVLRVDGLRLPVEFVAIHCVPTDRAKDWPAARWRELVDHITGTLGYEIVEVGLRPTIASDTQRRRRSICGQTSIIETAEVIRRARLFIGIDSGPAHLANAVGTAGVVLLGDYQGYPHFTPYSGDYANGAGAELVRADGPVCELGLQPVIDAVNRRIASSRAIAQ